MSYVTDQTRVSPEEAEANADAQSMAEQVKRELGLLSPLQPAATAAAPAEPVDDGEDLAAELAKWRRQAEEAERRHKGLQPVVQREVEARKALEQQMAQLQQELVDARLALVPEEQREDYRQRYQTWQQAQTAQQQVGQYEAMLGELGKRYRATELAQQSGEPIDVLMQFPTPESMAAYAQRIVEIKQAQAAAATRVTKTQEKQAAAASGQHRFEGGGAPSAPPGEPTTFEEARAAVLREMARQRR